MKSRVFTSALSIVAFLVLVAGTALAEAAVPKHFC
jgi:hypothetical protein